MFMRHLHFVNIIKEELRKYYDERKASQKGEAKSLNTYASVARNVEIGCDQSGEGSVMSQVFGYKGEKSNTAE